MQNLYLKLKFVTNFGLSSYLTYPCMRQRESTVNIRRYHGICLHASNSNFDTNYIIVSTAIRRQVQTSIVEFFTLSCKR